jgi:hypothetical protein
MGFWPIKYLVLQLVVEDWKWKIYSS